MAAKIFNMPGRIHLLWIGEMCPDGSLLDDLGSYSIESAPDPGEGLHQLEASGADVLLARFPLPGWTPSELQDEVERIATGLPVIILTEPLNALELRQRLQSALNGPTRPTRPAAPWRHLLVGESLAMHEVDRVIRLVGPRAPRCLLPAKPAPARKWRRAPSTWRSPRAAQPLVAVNCSALPENLLEAELFGHVKGAFTGAVQHRIGRFEQAHDSTLFLDEIGELPLDLQAKLLRVLQEREFQRLGSSETVQVDVRVIAASNVDLAERVSAAPVPRGPVLPPQRGPDLPCRRCASATSDIPMLVSHFVDKICRLEQMPLETRLARSPGSALCLMPGPAMCGSSRTPSRWRSS